MITAIKNYFGIAPPVDFRSLIQAGAVIVDVRTVEEFAHGHIPGAINIERDQLRRNLRRLPAKDMPIITCCASGVRSATAKRILEAYSYTNVHDGGAWARLQDKISDGNDRIDN